MQSSIEGSVGSGYPMHLTHSLPALPLPRTPPDRGKDRLLTGLGVALDSAIMRGVQLVVERTLISTREDVDSLKDSAHHLLDPSLQGDPGQFFDFSESPAKHASISLTRRRGIRGGYCLSYELSASYSPFLDRDGRPIGSVSNGDPILLEHWVRNDGEPRATIIGLHGFAMGRPRIDSLALFAREWFDRGLNVVLLTLPHHGVRKPANAQFSGDCFAVPHVARLSEAVREAIFEIFAVRNWLRETSDAPIGLLGLSLGGYLASLAIGLSDDFDFAIPMVPPACIGDLAWRVFRGTRHGPASASPCLHEDELRSSFRVHSPLAHELKMPREGILIVAGRGDRVVPPEHPAALWEHWGEPSIHWFSGSHLAPFGRRGIINAISVHLNSLGIVE